MIRKSAKEETLRPLRMEIRPLRDELADRVRAALTPSMRAKAHALIPALRQVTAAATFLNDC
jgi:hypothetical protein